MPHSTDSAALLRVIVSVADLDAALAFYRDLLDLPVTIRSEDTARLALPGGQEVLLHRRPPEVADTAVAVGFALPGVVALVQRWQASGGVVIDPPERRPWGEVMAVVRDADGHLVCLSEASSAVR